MYTYIHTYIHKYIHTYSIYASKIYDVITSKNKNNFFEGRYKGVSLCKLSCAACDELLTIPHCNLPQNHIVLKCLNVVGLFWHYVLGLFWHILYWNVSNWTLNLVSSTVFSEKWMFHVPTSWEQTRPGNSYQQQVGCKDVYIC